ncbi:MAG TPA: proline dehydrogenase family protein [Candidatus Acidoferrales bacterium]|nr:proline dehydrogenase family protein [Candidatus Acidoferrales bacterium]
MMRAAILSAADNGTVRRIVRRYGMQMGAKRFVAGETSQEFLEAALAANRRGFAVACGILGENVGDAAEARDAARRYAELLETFHARGFDANVAFKPTHVGLDVDPELAFENAWTIASVARSHRNTLRLDMEQSTYVDRTLALYRRLRDRYDGVGFVLQSYLYRSEGDLQAALSLAPNVRIVKGAYLEPSSIAYASKRDVDAAYVRLAETALSNEGYTAIATHDPAIVEHVEAFVRRRGLPLRGRFEFQMLYGISTPLARRLIDRGYRVRLAIPFGDYWFPYLMRRLAERPANLAFFLKGALGR